MNLSRRQFNRLLLRDVPLAGWGLLSAAMLPCLTPAPSTVVICRSAALRRRADDLDETSARRFLDDAVCQLTGIAKADSAWQSLFSPGQTVGIKLSCLPGRRLSSSRGLVAAIVSGLLRSGVSPDRIVIWERTERELARAGFRGSSAGARVLATDGLGAGGYGSDLEFCGSVAAFFSRIMEDVDALVNVPVLKDHDVAGISCGMKNFFGAIHNPNKYHGNNGDPYIADLSGHRFIRDKLRLVVADASRVQAHNGPAFFPAYAVEYGGLLVSRDPVALDWVGWQIIEELRRGFGLKSLRDSGREPVYITSADRRQLGHAAESYIRRIYRS